MQSAGSTEALHPMANLVEVEQKPHIFTTLRLSMCRLTEAKRRGREGLRPADCAASSKLLVWGFFNLRLAESLPLFPPISKTKGRGESFGEA